MYTLTIAPYSALPCALKTFKINGITADMNDFGEQVGEGDGEYGCKDSHFESLTTPKKGVLAHYKITKAEYITICDQLEDALCVGSCGWCS
jgi:hypothetical protein